MDKPKRLLFISSLDISDNRGKSDGVTKKILLQIKTFKELDFEVDYIYRLDGVVFLHKDGEEYKLTHHEGVHYKTMTRTYSALISFCKDANYDIIYVRYEGNNLAMWRFLAQQKKKDKGTKILAELPTYMGKWDGKVSFRNKLAFIAKRVKDLAYRMPIDYFVTFNDSDRIFGYKTIKIENFSDVNALPIKSDLTEKNSFNIIAMAIMTPSHGFDRIIKGLHQYYADEKNIERPVYLHLVGDGAVLDDWEQLADSLNVRQYVIRHGLMHGRELDMLMDKCNVAAASLAIFRKKCDKASELKIREYTARGIPFFYSAHEPQIVNEKFCMKVPHDETPIDVEAIITFYSRLEKDSIAEQMHQFAIKNFSCLGQLKKVINSL